MSGVSGLGQSPVILSFLLDPNLTTSSTITASGIGGNAAANVTGATVSAVYPRQILYRMIPHYPSPTVAGPLTSITVQNGGSYPTCTASTCTCTANLAVNTSTLNIWPGSTLGVIGVPAGGPGTNPPGPGNNQIQTFFNVIAVNSTSFDFSCPNPVHSGAAYTPGTYNTDGASTNPMVIVIQPAVAVPPNGTPAAWDGAQNGIATSPQAFAEINFTPPSSSSPTVCQITGPASPLPDGIAGTPYSETITTTGCASPVFSIVPGIPPGLSIGSSSGTISGTPTVPNPYSFIVEVTDANGNPTSAYGLTIDANPGAPGGTQILGTVNIQGQVTLK